MNQGKVVQIIGAVVDVEFPREGRLDPDAGFSLAARAFQYDTATQRARFEQVETTAGAKR